MAKRSNTTSPWGKVVAAMEKWDAMISGSPVPAKRANKPPAHKSRLSPFLLAAEQGDAKAIEKLIHEGANVHEAADPKMAFYHGADALILAARHGHLAAVKVLLRRGASVTTEAGYGSALGEAITHGHSNVVRLLVENGARNFGYSLFNAIEGRHLEVFQELTRAGIPFASFRSRQGDSLLESAIERKRDEIVRFLIGTGLKPNDGGPLVESAGRGNVELSRLLIKHGANPNQVNRMRRYPLGMACSRGHKQIAEMLLNHGADITLVDVRGWSCVDWARHGKHEDLVDWLDSIATKNGLRIPRQ